MKLIDIDEIIKILNDKMPESKLTSKELNEDLTSVGMDSITFISIIVSLEEEFDCEIPDEKLLLSEMNTIQKIIDVLHSLE